MPELVLDDKEGADEMDRDRGVHPRQPPGNETAVHEGVECDKSVKVEHLFAKIASKYIRVTLRKLGSIF